MGEVLKFVTPDGGLILRFLQKQLNFKIFLS